MHQAELVGATYGLGLANVWGYINDGDLHGAQQCLKRVITEVLPHLTKKTAPEGGPDSDS